MTERRRFRLVLIKPSHYDDEGYVIQWLFSPIPANSLACLYGIARDAIAAGRFGDTEVELVAIDETNTRVRLKKISGEIAAAGAGMVMLAGVQSNQFPRALDIARELRRAGVTVGIGGFHVSGTLAMLPGIEANVQAALDLGCFVFAGEAEEGRLSQVIEDVIAGRQRPIYNFMDDLPDLTDAPRPFAPRELVRRTAFGYSSFDAGRGCPFQCSFCTIINVQGRKSRRRSPADIEAIIRENHAQGVKSFFITDDNFARNRDWEAIFDRLIELRHQGQINFRLIIQVDTLCHRMPGFIEKAAKAGVRQVFIGLENISPDNLIAAKKRQNKITEYRKMLLAWKQAGVITYCGYITGFPNDTAERIVRDVETVKRELPLDILELFFLTPLPGSEDHTRLARAGVWMDPDHNKYDLDHCVTGHARMSKEEWEGAYRAAWRSYYSPAHRRTVMRRIRATNGSLDKSIAMIAWFAGAIRIERLHPLECGAFRRKVRRDRRSGLPIEPALVFYPRYWAETVIKLGRWVGLLGSLLPLYLALKHLPWRGYTDTALQSVVDEDETELEMFNSEEAKAFLVAQRRRDAIIHAAPSSAIGAEPSMTGVNAN